MASRDLEDLTAEVVAWIDPLLPIRNAFDTLIKTVEEGSEALHALHTGDGDVGVELADILILVLDAAHLLGVDLQKEFENKMAVNRARIWNKRNGCLQHANDC